MAYATVADVEIRYGRPLTATESAQVEAWIEDIEAQIGVRVPGLENAISSGVTTSALVKSVVAGAVKRVLDNPTGLRSKTLAFDDYSRTETVDAANSAGYLYLTDAEWNLLSPGSSGDAFTITPFWVP